MKEKMAERQRNTSRRNQRGANRRPHGAVQQQYEFLRGLQREEANFIQASQQVVLTHYTYESVNIVDQEITERNITVESTADVLRRKLAEARENEHPRAGIMPEGRVQNQD